MHTLTIVPQPPNERFPELDVSDLVATTARVYPKRGIYFYVCNPMDELIDAMESSEPFVAHAVVDMKAKQMILNPGTIDRIEEV